MRLRPLDGLRGVAILAVMANHTGVPLARGGYLGVDLFFVLSGYLITTLLLREHQLNGRIGLGRFYGRRALRLFPALAAVCVLAVAFGPWIGFSSRLEAVRGASFALSYLQDLAINFGWHTGFGLWHTWTLAIEEQFYLLWPPILIALLPRSLMAARATISIGIAYSMVAFAFWFHHVPDSPTAAVYYRPDARAGALLLGCLLALASVRRTIKVHAAIAWAGAAALVATLILAPEADRLSAFVVAMPLMWISSAVVVAAVVEDEDSLLARLLGWHPLASIGLISYGLYLYHPLCYAAVRHFTHWGRSAQIPPAIALAFAIAIASYRLLELPFLQLKKRITSPAQIGEPARTATTSSHPEATPVSV